MPRLKKRTRQQLLNKIYSGIGLGEEEVFSELRASSQARASSTKSWQALYESNFETDLDKFSKNTQKKKIAIQEALLQTKSLDFSEEMSELKWRMDILRGYKDVSQLNGDIFIKKDKFTKQQLSFDELYTLQKKKYSSLRGHRRQKMVDPQYIDMVGNMHLRNEKRKANFESTMVQQFKVLDLAINK